RAGGSDHEGANRGGGGTRRLRRRAAAARERSGRAPCQHRGGRRQQRRLRCDRTRRRRRARGGAGGLDAAHSCERRRGAACVPLPAPRLKIARALPTPKPIVRHLPNLICLIRLALIWPIVVTLHAGRHVPALVLFMSAAVSDGLDGYLAKRFNWTSEQIGRASWRERGVGRGGTAASDKD